MNKQKGFTLIELLVVVAIIGLLVAVVLTAFHNSKDKVNGSENPEKYCREIGLNKTVAELPASCIKYFK